MSALFQSRCVPTEHNGNLLLRMEGVQVRVGVGRDLGSSVTREEVNIVK